MDQFEFSVAGATGNSNASATAKSAVPFFSPLASLLSCFSPCPSLQRCVLSARKLSRLSRKGRLEVSEFMFSSDPCFSSFPVLTQLIAVWEHENFRSNSTNLCLRDRGNCHVNYAEKAFFLYISYLAAFQLPKLKFLYVIRQ